MERKRWVLAGIALAAFGMACAMAALVTWEAPAALTKALLAALSSKELRVEAGAVRLGLLRGLVLERVAVDLRLTDGRLTARAESAAVDQRLLGLLTGRLNVAAIRLLDPKVEVTWDAAPAPRARALSRAAPASTAEAPAAAGSGATAGRWTLAVGVERVVLENGTFVMRDDGAADELVRVEGLDLELTGLAIAPGAKSAVAGLTGDGKVRAERLLAAGVEATEVRGTLAFAGGHLLVSKLALPTTYGPLGIEALDLDLGRDPYAYTLDGGGTPLATRELLGAAAGFGDGTLQFAVAGDGSPRGGPRGKGTLAVAAGKLGSLPLLAAVEGLLAGTEIVGRPYEPFVVPFDVDGERLTLRPFALVAGNLRLGAEGRVDAAGPLDLHLELSLPRADVAVAEIPNEVLEALTDVDGRVKLPLSVRGTLDAPKVAFDRRAWGRLAGRRLAAEGFRLLGDALAGHR
jgi:hypothetical protein